MRSLITIGCQIKKFQGIGNITTRTPRRRTTFVALGTRFRVYKPAAADCMVNRTSVSHSDFDFQHLLEQMASVHDKIHTEKQWSLQQRLQLFTLEMINEKETTLTSKRKENTKYMTPLFNS